MNKLNWWNVIVTGVIKQKDNIQLKGGNRNSWFNQSLLQDLTSPRDSISSLHTPLHHTTRHPDTMRVARGCILLQTLLTPDLVIVALIFRRCLFQWKLCDAITSILNSLLCVVYCLHVTVRDYDITSFDSVTSTISWLCINI